MKKTILSLIAAAATLAALDSVYATRCQNNIGASNRSKKEWARAYASKKALLIETAEDTFLTPKIKKSAVRKVAKVETVAKPARVLSNDPRAVAKRAARAAAKWQAVTV